MRVWRWRVNRVDKWMDACHVHSTLSKMWFLFCAFNLETALIHPTHVQPFIEADDQVCGWEYWSCNFCLATTGGNSANIQFRLESNSGAAELLPLQRQLYHHHDYPWSVTNGKLQVNRTSGTDNTNSMERFLVYVVVSPVRYTCPMMQHPFASLPPRSSSLMVPVSDWIMTTK